jgi:hypothetical protein
MALLYLKNLVCLTHGTFFKIFTHIKWAERYRKTWSNIRAFSRIRNNDPSDRVIKARVPIRVATVTDKISIPVFIYPTFNTLLIDLGAFTFLSVRLYTCNYSRTENGYFRNVMLGSFT